MSGTPSYMAPELFTGKPASKQSDVYAMGVVMTIAARADEIEHLLIGGS